tara:strand:+ start:1266 stop:1532 length:267 start_codon:yes stop_codon:yes gene_type:complete
MTKKEEALTLALEAFKANNLVYEFERIIAICEEALAKPPQRQWVGLTDEEIAAAVRLLYGTNESAFVGLTDDISTARAIEAKLKERNT